MQILRQSNHLDRPVDNDLIRQIQERTENLIDIDLISNGIVMLTPNRQVISVNLAASMLLRQPKSELIGRDFPVKIEPDSIYQTEGDLDGKREVLQFQCKQIRKNGQVYGFLVEISSITALRNAEGAAESAKESSKLKSDFLAAMSHEIRNPMTGVIGMTSLLLDTQLSEEQLRYVQAIKSSGDVLLAILNDVLDLSKIEAGKLTLEEKDFRLSDIIEDTIGLFSEPAKRKGLLLTNLIEPDVPRTLRGDATRIQQVITNLVSNAVKFTSTGHVIVKAFVEENGGETGKGHNLHVAVSDTGPGLAPGEAKELFKPFEQIRRVMQGVSAGTGLGLALSRQLVEVMNGRIGVESECGKGSTFWFSIPIARVGQSSNHPWDLASHSVVIVSSSPEMGRLLSNQIKVTGAKCQVLTPAKAARALKNAKLSGDMIILDIQPGPLSRFSKKFVYDLKAQVSQNQPILLLCNDPKSVQLDGLDIEIMAKSPLFQSQLCGVVARLLGTKQNESDFDRRRDFLAVTKMQPISRRNGNPRILVVEDDPINQAVMKMMLERLGFSTDIAANGIEAVDTASKFSYAAILMDYYLPGLDGITATAMIRGHEKTYGRRTPIIATTASVVPCLAEKCFEAGMDGCLTKPFSIEHLADSLKKHIEASTDTYVDENAMGTLSKLSISGDGDDFLGKMVDLFAETAPPIFDRLHAAILACDSAGVIQAAHRLKGSAGHFGAYRLTRSLEELENKGREKDLADCEALFLRAKSEFTHVIEILKDQKTQH